MKPADPRIAAHLANVPAKFASLAGRALRGECRSPREGIKAKRLECSNYTTDEAAQCTVWRCPLWHLNPYRARQPCKAAA